MKYILSLFLCIGFMCGSIGAKASDYSLVSYVIEGCNTKSLEGTNPDLQAVVHRAMEITTIDFCVVEGLRSVERQGILVARGSSTTMNSRHLTGNAVDLAVYVHGKVSWEWPLYKDLSEVMKKASSELNIPIEWGGDWKTFKDGLHFQIPWVTEKDN